MKKYMIGLLSGLMLAGSIAFSEPAGATTPANTAPAPASVPQQKMLWDYQRELELSDKQVAALKQDVVNFENVMNKDRAKLRTVETDLHGLIQKDGNPETIKIKVRQSAAIQADMRIADILTARKINKTLTPKQLEQWQEIQKKIQAEAKPKS